jgi:threonine/homoserine/homoserine lactone efflux protein
MAASSIAAFWAIALLLIIVPGADWAFVIGVVIGGRSVRPAVGGLAIGYAAMTVVVAAGVGDLVARSAAALTALTVAGGLYLIWLGVRTVSGARKLNSQPGHGTAEQTAPGTDRAVLLKGIGVSGLNPKGLLVFLALAPQFVTTSSGWPVPGQLGVLGLVFTLSCAGFYLCLGTVASKLLHAKPETARIITRLSGAAMCLIGALLLADRLA